MVRHVSTKLQSETKVFPAILNIKSFKHSVFIVRVYKLAESIFSCLYVYGLRSDHLGFDNPTEALFQEKIHFSPLRNHWLHIALHLRVEPCEIVPITVVMLTRALIEHVLFRWVKILWVQFPSFIGVTILKYSWKFYIFIQWNVIIYIPYFPLQFHFPIAHLHKIISFFSEPLFFQCNCLLLTLILLSYLTHINIF